MKDRKPLTDATGEARELDAEFFKTAKRGRPAILDSEKVKRVNITLDQDVIRAAKERGIKISTRVNALLRKDLGLG